VTKLSAKGFRELAGKVDFIARDLVSMNRMKEFAPCKLGADCAFLMNPELPNNVENMELINYIESPMPLVGICLRDEDFLLNGSFIDIMGFAKGLIGAMDEAGAGLLLIPHHPFDLKALKHLAETLNGLKYQNFFLIDKLLSTGEIKYVVGECYHVITSRMHVAIASLGMSTPITCVPYAGKFEGLFQHFSLENASLDRNLLTDEIYIKSKLLERLENSEKIQEHIAKNLPRIKDLSRYNYHGL
jgi:polysaccharide pyruvyl transferase WcaK-like protein